MRDEGGILRFAQDFGATTCDVATSTMDGMWSYLINEDRKLVITRAWGMLTGADISQHRRKLGSDPRFHRSFSQLVDLTRVTSVALDYKIVRGLSHERLFSQESRRAFVAPSLLTHAMSRMFISIRESTGEAEQMDVFKDRKTALRWLSEADAKSPSPHDGTPDDLLRTRKATAEKK